MFGFFSSSREKDALATETYQISEDRLTVTSLAQTPSTFFIRSAPFSPISSSSSSSSSSSTPATSSSFHLRIKVLKPPTQSTNEIHLSGGEDWRRDQLYAYLDDGLTFSTYCQGRDEKLPWKKEGDQLDIVLEANQGDEQPSWGGYFAINGDIQKRVSFHQQNFEVAIRINFHSSVTLLPCRCSLRPSPTICHFCDYCPSSHLAKKRSRSIYYGPEVPSNSIKAAGVLPFAVNLSSSASSEIWCLLGLSGRRNVWESFGGIRDPSQHSPHEMEAVEWTAARELYEETAGVVGDIHTTSCKLSDPDLHNTHRVQTISNSNYTYFLYEIDYNPRLPILFGASIQTWHEKEMEQIQWFRLSQIQDALKKKEQLHGHPIRIMSFPDDPELEKKLLKESKIRIQK